jgi:hypothetical protein
MTKAEHEAEVDRITRVMERMIVQEYNRAMKEGKARVHAFMVEANANVFRSARPEAAIRAVFQQAENEFGAPRLTLSEYLYGPQTIKEAVDATVSP